MFSSTVVILVKVDDNVQPSRLIPLQACTHTHAYNSIGRFFAGALGR